MSQAVDDGQEDQAESNPAAALGCIAALLWTVAAVLACHTAYSGIRYGHWHGGAFAGMNHVPLWLVLVLVGLALKGAASISERL